MIELMKIYLNYHQRMVILILKKRINCDKCSFATKQHMLGVFAIDEILFYRGSPFPASRTLCHPGATHYRPQQPSAAQYSLVKPSTAI